MDFASRRYGVLPSKLLESGDTIDIQIAQFALQFESWIHKNPGKKVGHGLSQEQMLAQLEEVRNAKSGWRTKI